jgi:hypothetical protein
MTQLLFGVLLQGLKILGTQQATKYHDRVLQLRKSWLEEYSKPRSERSNSDLDEIELELAVIAKTFAELGDIK